MTEDEFFALLRGSGRQWEVVCDRFIRTCDPSPGTGLADCPITAAYYAARDGSVDLKLAYWAGERLDLDKVLIERIVEAADTHSSNISDIETFKIRIRLLMEIVWK